MSNKLNPTLTLESNSGSTGAFEDAAISLSVTDELTIANPIVGISKIQAEASSGSLVTIKPSGSANQYVYIKNTGFQADGTTATTNQLSVFFNGTDTDGDTNTLESLRLAADEFAFFPCMSNKVVQIRSSSSHVILTEYAYFTAG